jgi:O-antigen/teichoic acid export membrane protein
LAKPQLAALSASRVLASNAGINLATAAASALAAALALPVLVHHLGLARFGALTLIWAVARYSSFCDLGIGAALTTMIAENLAGDRETRSLALIWTGLALMAGVGALLGLVLFALSPSLIRLLKLAPELQGEVAMALHLLAATLPFLLSAGAWRGVLAAFQRFDLINAVRGPLDLICYLGLTVLALFSHNLALMVGILMAARVVSWTFYWLIVMRLLPELRRSPRLPDRFSLRALCSFGGWMTIAQVINPLMADLDRFLIGSWLSLDAVAYYSTPAEVVQKLWQLPLMLEGTWFAAFAHRLAQPDRAVARLFAAGDKLIFCALLPPTVILALFAREILGIWIGEHFAVAAAPVLSWLSLMVLICGFSEMPLLIIQAAQRPDLVAKVRLVQLPIYPLLMWQLIRHQGVAGAALAQVIRLGFETVVLSLLAHHLVPNLTSPRYRMAWLSGALATVLIISHLELTMPAKLAVVTCALALFLPLAWVGLLDSAERAQLRRWRSQAARRLPGLRPAAG